MARLPDKSGASDTSYLPRMQATAPQCRVVPARRFTQCCDVPCCNCLMCEVYLHVQKKKVDLWTSENTMRHSTHKPVYAVQKKYFFLLLSYINCGQNVEILMLKHVHIVTTVLEETISFQQ